MNDLADLIKSLDERDLVIKVNAALSPAGVATADDGERARPMRREVIRVALAREYLLEALDLEKRWAGYPARRTTELEREIVRLKREAVLVLPDGVPWELVAPQRGDGTTVEPIFEGVA